MAEDWFKAQEPWFTPDTTKGTPRPSAPPPAVDWFRPPTAPPAPLPPEIKSSQEGTTAPTEAAEAPTATPMAAGTGVEEIETTGEAGFPGAYTARRIFNLPGDISEGLFGLAGKVVTDPESITRAGEGLGRWMKRVAQEPSQLVETGAEFVGPTFGEAYRTGSLEPLFMEEGRPSWKAMEQTAVDAILAPFTIGAVGQPASVLAALGAKQATRLPLVGKPLAKAGEWAGSKVIPRWGFTPELSVSEAAKQGEIFMETLGAKGLVSELGELPDYARKFAGPRYGGKAGELGPSPFNFFGSEGPRFEKALTAPGGLPRNPLTGELAYLGREADFAIDANGWVRSLAPEKFAKLGLDEQQRIMNFRSVVDANSRVLLDRGILKPEQYDPGYLHRAYAADVSPTAHREMLYDVSDPVGRKIMADVRALLVKRKYSDPDAMIDYLLEHGPEIMAQQGARPTGVFGSAAVALIQRINMATEIKALLGPLDPGVLHAGKTLDYQIRMIANDAFMERATTMKARDGRRFVVPAEATTGIPGRGYLPLQHDTNLYGRWGGAWVHPDMQDAVGVLRGDTFTRPINQLISYWKASKVAFNMGTWINNIAGDAFIFSTAAGASMVNPANAGHYKDAARMMKDLFLHPEKALATHPELVEAIRTGAVVPGWASNEISRMYGILAEQHGFTGLQAWTNAHVRGLTAQIVGDEGAAMLGRVGKTLTGAGETFYRGTARFYDLQDQWSRFGSYLTLTRRGQLPIEATTAIVKAYPNYETTSAVGRFLRGESGGGLGVLAGGPFSSFPMETMRVYSQLVAENPARAFAISMIPLSMITVMSGANGLTPLDYLEFHNQLPSHQRGKIWVPMEKDPSTGEQSWVDLTQVFGLGEWMAASPTLSKLRGRQVPQGPLANIMSGPHAAPLAIAMNTDPGTGRKIYDQTRGDSMLDLMAYMIKSIAPAPSGAISFLERQKRAAAGVPYEKWESEPESLGTSLGRSLAPQFFRHTPESWLFEQRAAQEAGVEADLERGFNKILRDPTLTERERIRRLENIQRSQDENMGKRY